MVRIIELIKKFIKKGKESKVKNVLSVMEGCNKEEIEKVVNVINTIMVEKGKLEDEAYEGYYKEHYSAEIAINAVWSVLEDNTKGEKEITWNLFNAILEEYEEVKLKAYYIDSQDWELMQMYNIDVREGNGNTEGNEFHFTLNPDINYIPMPLCNAHNISDTRTIKGNCINSNCDVNGSLMGSKAEILYVFWITDIEQFAIVEEKYWCL